jgi:hypothetical protein
MTTNIENYQSRNKTCYKQDEVYLFLPKPQFLNLIWNQKQNFAIIHLLESCFQLGSEIPT